MSKPNIFDIPHTPIVEGKTLIKRTLKICPLHVLDLKFGFNPLPSALTTKRLLIWNFGFSFHLFQFICHLFFFLSFGGCCCFNSPLELISHIHLEILSAGLSWPCPLSIPFAFLITHSGFPSHFSRMLPQGTCSLGTLCFSYILHIVNSVPNIPPSLITMSINLKSSSIGEIITKPF